MAAIADDIQRIVLHCGQSRRSSVTMLIRLHSPLTAAQLALHIYDSRGSRQAPS